MRPAAQQAVRLSDWVSGQQLLFTNLLLCYDNVLVITQGNIIAIGSHLGYPMNVNKHWFIKRVAKFLNGLLE